MVLSNNLSLKMKLFNGLSNKVLYLFKISLILSDSMINEKSPQEEIDLRYP